MDTTKNYIDLCKELKGFMEVRRLEFGDYFYEDELGVLDIYTFWDVEHSPEFNERVVWLPTIHQSIYMIREKGFAIFISAYKDDAEVTVELGEGELEDGVYTWGALHEYFAPTVEQVLVVALIKVMRGDM